MKIRIFYDEINYRLRNSKKILELIEKVIRKNGKISDNLYFIFTNDEKIQLINEEFLKHNYNTDVIAFNYNQGKIINGEIYISIETIKENAYNYKVSLKDEVLRVMIHGTLHLCDYNDGTRKEKNIMKNIEDYWITEFKKK